MLTAELPDCWQKTFVSMLYSHLRAIVLHVQMMVAGCVANVGRVHSLAPCAQQPA